MKNWRLFFSISASLTLVGCSMTGRSFLTEMEQDDSSYFTPREDFPVVAGDTGRSWRNKREIKSRTPASLSEQLQDREANSLDSQLHQLETAQSEGASRHYEQYKKRLGSTSERIYFLQLPSKADREHYLNSRGLLEVPSYTAYEMGHAAEQSELLVDMSKEDVLQSWGRPERIDIAGKASYENERWVYQRDGAVKYIYFEGGKVGGWTTNSSASTRGQNPFN